LFTWEREWERSCGTNEEEGFCCCLVRTTEGRRFDEELLCEFPPSTPAVTFSTDSASLFGPIIYNIIVLVQYIKASIAKRLNRYLLYSR
jgi:hypothetical protein